MKELEKALYKITALTNLHVGSGHQNYGIVDKLVQRDPLTGFPVIHSSSLKGALKVYCIDVLDLDKDPILSSFGKGDSPGMDKYFSAHLFTIPVRSDVKPYFRATCPSILNEWAELLKTFGIDQIPYAAAIKVLADKVKTGKKEFTFFNKENGTTATGSIIEDIEVSSETCNTPIDGFDSILEDLNYDVSELVIIRDDIFMEICENLPVIARNRLDEQKNLWYEEVVPRQSEFLFLYMGTDDTKEKVMDKIEENSKKQMPVQIGANASVGYGFCKIEKTS